MKQVGYSPLQTSRVSRPGDAYLHRATEAFGMRRSGWQNQFLAGLVCATTGLACGVKVLQWLSPRDTRDRAGAVLCRHCRSIRDFLTVLMVPRLGSLREITVAILGLYPAIVYRMTSPLVLAGYDEHQHAQSLLNLLNGGAYSHLIRLLPVSPFYPGLELLPPPRSA
jgi:hypothetical protein